ncbi:MFS transporter [Geobacillus sp. FSL W8-0032]|uniref:Na(+), Li(+), K(+)/H(+) antiporter n=1 Tax=Geobacillus icigianus TaxID=1430331 RepID=A0ABU6BD22_9BACL|nr:MFS transporter [Geobacillus icigianus]MEB3749815.1 Na(+), Li(+), K(+)/H(+) antiporter [Geobacillus icigianus]
MRIREWDRNLKVRLFGEALMNTTFWMFFPFMAIYFADSFGKETASVLLIVSQLFSVVANLCGGYCADVFGRKRMMVLSAYGQGAAFLFFALASTPWWSSPFVGFLCFTFAGICGAFYWPASQAMVADVVPEQERSHVFAVFYTSVNISVVIGPTIGGLFYADHQFALLMAAAGSCFAMATLLAKQLRETAPLAAPSQKAGSWTQFWREQIRQYVVIVRDRTFFLFIAAGVLVAQTFMQLDLLIPVYTKEIMKEETVWGRFTVDGAQAFGLLIAENGLLVALGTVVVTRWMGRYNERWVFIGSSMVYGVTMWLFSHATSIIELMAVMALFTFAELMTAGLQQAFVSKLAPRDMRGQYFAAASLRFTIGRMLAPVSLAAVTWIGYTWTFAYLGLLALASAGLYAWMFRQAARRSSVSLS